METKHFIGTDAEGTRWYVEIRLDEVNKHDVHMRDHSRGTLTHEFGVSGFGIEKGRRDASMAGQIVHFISFEGFKPAKGWTIEDIQSLTKIAERWHLNDMHAGSYEQEGWTYDTHRGQTDSFGYRYGSEWLKENIPADILTEIKRLQSLPTGNVPTNY